MKRQKKDKEQKETQKEASEGGAKPGGQRMRMFHETQRDQHLQMLQREPCKCERGLTNNKQVPSPRAVSERSEDEGQARVQ